MVKETLDKPKNEYKNKIPDKKVTAINPVNKQKNPIKSLLNTFSSLKINTEAQKTYEEFTYHQC